MMVARGYGSRCQHQTSKEIAGVELRRCVRCGRYLPSTRRKPVTKPHPLKSALRILEGLQAPRPWRLEDVKSRLSGAEYGALIRAIRFAAEEARSHERLPRYLNFEGVRLRLRHTNFGRVFILSQRTGKALVLSGYGARW